MIITLLLLVLRVTICGPLNIESIPDIPLSLGETLSETFEVKQYFFSEVGSMVWLNLQDAPMWIDLALLSPDYLGESTGGQFMRRLFLNDTWVYSSGDFDGLSVFDISDPYNPDPIQTSVDYGSNSKSSSVSGSYLFVAEYNQGVVSVDNSDKLNPEEKYTLGLGDCILSGAYSIYIEGDFAYIGSVGKVSVADISNPDSLSCEGNSIEPNALVECVYFENDILYAGDVDTDGFQIYSVSVDKSTITLLSSSSCGTNDIFFTSIQYPLAYVLNRDGVLCIFNVTNPGSPDEVESIALSTFGYGSGTDYWKEIHVDGDFAFLVSNRELVVLNISDIFAPTVFFDDEYDAIDSDMFGVALAVGYNYIVSATYINSPRYAGIRVYKFGDVEITGDPSEGIEVCGDVPITVRATDKSGYTDLVLYINLDGVCQNGTCSPINNTCDCDPPGYYGSFCEKWECFGKFYTDEDVCNRNGRCVAPNHCICNETFYGDECVTFFCFGVFGNESHVCSGNGNCTGGNDICQCNKNYFGENCNITTCQGIFSNVSYDTNLGCNGRGRCTSFENCECDYPGVLNSMEPHCDCAVDYFGFFCNETKCDEFWFNDTENVCNSHGICDIQSRICNCTSSNYTGVYCETWYCDDVDRNNLVGVCSGNGVCLDADYCSCNTEEKYTGTYCSNWECYNETNENVDIVCGGHGVCFSPDVCDCQDGYYSTEVTGPCTEWDCGKYSKDEESVCNGRGECIDRHRCECSSGYSGDDCEEYSCGGYSHDDYHVVCSGRGVCGEPESCVCDRSYYTGKNCETNTLYGSVMAPLLSVSGGFFLLCFASCFFVVLCCVFCICIFILVGCVSAVGMLSTTIFRQKMGMKKFSKLKNVDLLLKEQELEEDTSIAHLRINKELFTIGMDDIQLIKILGQGGSNSTVYEALWSGRIVGFKLFKTRDICSNQTYYDEFEREVEILSSVSHPSVLRFFGCSLKPPRVGFLMEFCSKGDCEAFLGKYKKKNLRMYPLSEKFRIMRECISGCKYLHERNIIHRDLKLLNILLDENEHCKIMDFGLSKIVDRMSQNKTSRVGTSFFMAPEIIFNTKYDEKCDVFSFSMMMYLMICERFSNPYEVRENLSIEFKVAQNPDFRPQIAIIDEIVSSTKGASKYLWISDVIQKCWNHYPEDRYSFQELGEVFDSKDIVITGGEGRSKGITTTKEEEIDVDDQIEQEISDDEGAIVEFEKEDYEKMYQNLLKKYEGLKDEHDKLKKKYHFRIEKDQKEDNK